MNPNEMASNDEIDYDENHAAAEDQENIILSNKSSAVGKLQPNQLMCSVTQFLNVGPAPYDSFDPSNLPSSRSVADRSQANATKDKKAIAVKNMAQANANFDYEMHQATQKSDQDHLNTERTRQVSVGNSEAMNVNHFKTSDHLNPAHQNH